MKKISNWSLAGIIIGLVFSLGSFIRYYIIYQDLSEVVIGVFIGLLIMTVSFLYNKQLSQENTILAMEDYLADKQDEKR